MAITSGAHPKDLWPGIKAHFGAAYKEHPLEYAQVFDTETSDKLFEERVQYRGHGLAPIKAQNASISFEDTAQGYISRITNIVYALGAVVTREAIEDGQYESIATREARFIKFSLRQTLENVGANVLNRAATVGYTHGDGQVLACTTHPEANGNQSNLLSPAAELSEGSLEDLLVQIANATDSQGLKISLIGEKLVIPTALMFEATRIVRSTLQSGAANNDVNALRLMGMLPGGIVVNHYLTSTVAWGVKTNVPEGLIYQSRRGFEFGKDNDFDTENAKIKGSVRGAFGIGDWRSLYWSTGS